MIFLKLRLKSFNIKDIFFPQNKLFIFHKLNKRIQRFTVLRSPHINKTAREQFQIQTYKRIIYILNTIKESLVLHSIRNYLQKSTSDVLCTSICLKTNSFSLMKNELRTRNKLYLSPRYLLHYLSIFEYSK